MNIASVHAHRSPSATAFQFATASQELSQPLPPTPYATSQPQQHFAHAEAACSQPPPASTPFGPPIHPSGSPSTAELLRAAHSGSTTAQLSRQLAQAFPARRAVSFALPLACEQFFPLCPLPYNGLFLVH